MAIITVAYDSIQTVAYQHTVEIDTELWERMTGEEFDHETVDIYDLREYVGWGSIIETGGDVLDEQCENLREI